MTRYRLRRLILAELLCLFGSSSPFILSPITSNSRRSDAFPSATQINVGGKGWENNSFLDSLGGNDEDQEKEKAKYLEQQEARKAFNKRQEEMLKNPAAQKFMEDYLRAQERRPDDLVGDITGGGYDDPFAGDEVSASSSGGTRLQGMMAKSQKQQQRMRGPPGLEQKLAVPLDFDGGIENDDVPAKEGET